MVLDERLSARPDPATRPGQIPADPAILPPSPFPPRSALDEKERRELSGLLDVFEARALDYFLDNRAYTGLFLDRALNLPKSDPAMPVSGMASIAATGYGLAALAIGAERGMIDRREAAVSALETMTFVRDRTPAAQRGWLAHFQHAGSGANYRDSEISSIDTILFVLGAIAAGECFGGAVRREAEALFDRIDFRMMLTNDGAFPGKLSFSHGFKLDGGRPEFIAHEWGAYSEGILVPLLALASETFPVPAECWDRGWDRSKTWQRGAMSTFAPLPLFTFYYPLGFLDLRGRRDRNGEDLFAAAANAVRMQIDHCGMNGYPPGLFGLTACDGPDGYEAYYPGHPRKEMPISPLAMLACLPLAEREARDGIEALERYRLTDTHYGFAASYDPASGWVAPDMIGIDVGSTLLMVDAYRHGTVHGLCARSRVIGRALERAGIS